MAFTDAQEQRLVMCSFIFSLVSLISSVTIISYWLVFKGLRKDAFKLVVFTALSDAIRCVGNLMGSPNEGALCKTQGFLKTFGGVASLFWVGCMAYTIHLLAAERVRIVDSKVLLKRYQWVSWPAALTAAVVPLILDTYRPTGGWCWITKYDEGVVLRWTSFYGILWVFFAWICYVYISLWLYMRGYPKQEEIRKISRLWIYPLILLFCYGPASVRRIWEQVGNPPYWLAVCHICFSSLHGTLNALAYGRNRDIRMLNSRILDLSCGSCMGLRKVDERAIDLEVWRSRLPMEVSRIETENEKSNNKANDELAVKPLAINGPSNDREHLKVEMTSSVDPDEKRQGADVKEANTSEQN